MTRVTLVFGGRAAAREQAIAAHLDPNGTNAAIIEGLPDASGLLENKTLEGRLQVVRVAPGCPCCIGNLTLRVTLNRLLRHAPAQLFISLDSGSHKEQLKTFLQDRQYQEHLRLGPELDCD